MEARSEVFAAAVDAAGDFSTRDLEEAQLGAFKSLDAPRAPAARGAARFGGLPDDERQRFRDRLLACTPAPFGFSGCSLSQLSIIFTPVPKYGSANICFNMVQQVI